MGQYKQTKKITFVTEPVYSGIPKGETIGAET
jgi:hypothetical protein